MGFCSTLKYKHCEQHCLSHVFVRFTYHNFLSQQVLPQMADATAECRSASITEIRPRYVFCIIRQILDFPTHLYTAEAWFSLLFQADLNYIFSGGSGSSACWPCRARLGQRHVRAQHWTPLQGQHRSRGAPSHFESQEAYFGSVPPLTHPAHLPAVPKGVLHRLVVAEVEEVEAAVLGPARLLTACCHHTHRLLQPGKGVLHPLHTRRAHASSHFHRHLRGEGWTAELLKLKNYSEPQAGLRTTKHCVWSANILRIPCVLFSSMSNLMKMPQTCRSFCCHKACIFVHPLFSPLGAKEIFGACIYTTHNQSLNNLYLQNFIKLQHWKYIYINVFLIFKRSRIWDNFLVATFSGKEQKIKNLRCLIFSR